MKEEQFDIKDGNRTYYYNILGKMEPDYENMLAYLLDEGVLFAGVATAKYDGDKECIGLFININDYFIPAADSEIVTYNELPKLYELYSKSQDMGVAEFVAQKRNIPNIYWRDEGSDFQKRMKKN